MAYYPEFKLLVVGDSGVGKTTFVNRFLTGEFDARYTPTIDVTVLPLLFYTNFGPVRFNCYDVSGDDAFDGQRGGHYLQADCAIIMFDVTSRITLKRVTAWYHDIVRVCDRIPVVLCGNKSDQGTQRHHFTRLKLDHDIELPLFEISSKSDSEEQLETVLLWLMRTLGRDENIVLVEPPAVNIPDVRITAEQIAMLEAETAAAAMAVPLPDEDEDL